MPRDYKIANVKICSKAASPHVPATYYLLCFKPCPLLWCCNTNMHRGTEKAREQYLSNASIQQVDFSLTSLFNKFWIWFYEYYSRIIYRWTARILQSAYITWNWVKKLMAKESGFHNLHVVLVGETLATRQQRWCATNSDYSANDRVIFLTGLSERAGREGHQTWSCHMPHPWWNF